MKIRKGYTLAELLVAVLILGSVMAVLATAFSYVVETNVKVDKRFMDFTYDNMLSIQNEIKSGYLVSISDDEKSLSIQDYPIDLSDGSSINRTHTYNIENDTLYRDGRAFIKNVNTEDSYFRFIEDTEEQMVRIEILQKNVAKEEHDDGRLIMDVFIRADGNMGRKP